jgi:hypothetical protein
MEIREEMLQIRQAGMEKAAAVWEALEHLPQPIEPADVYKAVSSVKCAEFLARTRSHKLAPALWRCVAQFLDATLGVVGDEAGDKSEGMRALSAIEETMPMTDEVFNDAVAYATRQHVYDGVLLLAAVKLGKETETKKCLDDMQAGVAMVLVMSYLKEGVLGGGADFDPDEPQA